MTTNPPTAELAPLVGPCASIADLALAIRAAGLRAEGCAHPQPQHHTQYLTLNTSLPKPCTLYEVVFTKGNSCTNPSTYPLLLLI